MIRLALTDDHELIRRGISEMLSKSKEVDLLHCWCDAAETLKGVETADVDILLLDINLPDMQGDVLCKSLLEVRPALGIIGLSTFDQSIVVKDFIEAGAMGYLTKDASLEVIEEAASNVMRGKQYLAGSIQQRFDKMNADSKSVRLTRREQDILKLIAMELTTKEIADKLCLSDKTVETHRSHLFQKLGVRNIAGLVREAILRGYVS